MNSTELLDCPTPNGDALTTDAEFCAYLLTNAGVALVPGRAFGLPGHFRLSYAYAMDDPREGCARIASALSDLS